MLLNAFISCSGVTDIEGHLDGLDDYIQNMEEDGSCKNTEKSCPVSFKDLFNINMVSQPVKPKVPIYNGFRLPIEYLDQLQIFSVSDIVVTDLELTYTNDASFGLFPGTSSSIVYSAGSRLDASGGKRPEKATIYEHFIQPTNVFAGEMTREIQKRYTTNTRFLEDTQTILGEMDQYKDVVSDYMATKLPDFQPNAETFLEIWKEIKEDAYFLDKHSYLEWPMLEHLNHSEEFLQMFSMVNIVSPLFSLFIPFLFLIFPLVILKLQQVEITIEQYIETLREIAKHHFIGKALSSEFTIQGIVYLGFTAGLYLLQIYQNVNSCMQFYSNLVRMNSNLEHIRDHIRHSIHRMELFVKLHTSKLTYNPFLVETAKHIRQLSVLLEKLEEITPFSVSITKACSIGYMLQAYYQLYSNTNYEESIRYSVGFGAYMDILVGIHAKLKQGHLGKSTFVETDQLVFRDQYYPTHSPDLCVKNTYDVSHNMIITGVNASGKTTFLKTTAINIILTQQFGVGFYSEGVICPFTHIHSYLNIPDTSGRDSLFQAESRRCKEILDAISQPLAEVDTSRHFVIFDELFSGTNPDEAIKSAVSLLRYLSKFDNVRFILTTHYLKVCKKFKKASSSKPAETKKSNRICNYKMNVNVEENGNIQYLYTIKKGISKIQGGVEILKTMNYPEEIIQDIRKSK